MTGIHSEDYFNRLVSLRQRSQTMYQAILSTDAIQFESLLTDMAKYSNHELRMLLQGCFMNFEHCDKSPWLILFSSEEYLSKLVSILNVFEQTLTIYMRGMNSQFNSINPFTVSLQAGASVLFTVIKQVPKAADAIIAQSAELLRAAIELKSNQETVSILDLLYQNGVKLDAKNSTHRGETALIFATRINEKQSVSWLIEHGVDANIQDDYGFTALHYAAATTTGISCRDLLEAGADPNIQSHNGITALLLVNTAYCCQLKYYNIIPKEFYVNRTFKFSIDIGILRLFYQFGSKVFLARSPDNPSFQCSTFCIDGLARQQSILKEVEIFVPVLYNAYDHFVHIPFRGVSLDSPSRVHRNRMILLCKAVKHGYPVGSLRFQTADTNYQDISEDIRSTIYYLLRYFQQPYPTFLLNIVVEHIEQLMSRNKISILPHSCYIINAVLELGSNSKYSNNTLSLYFKSICLILQLVSFHPSKLELSLFDQVCRYLELTVLPFWYNQMLSTKGCNDPNNYMCVCIGAWMSFFMYIWQQSFDDDNVASYQKLERFYKRISNICEEFSPLICMMLYSTQFYYMSRSTESYGYGHTPEPFLKTLSSLHPNFIKDTIILLISLGEDINNTTFYRKQTALLIAVESNARENFINFLLQQGASPYAVDTLGNSIKDYSEIGLVSTNLIPLIDKITVQPRTLQLMCVKSLAYHKVNIGNLLEHKALRRLFIVFT